MSMKFEAKALKYLPELKFFQIDKPIASESKTEISKVWMLITFQGFHGLQRFQWILVVQTFLYKTK